MVFPATRKGTRAPHWGVNEKTREPSRGERGLLVGLGLGMGFTPGRDKAIVYPDSQLVNSFFNFCTFLG